MLIPACSKPDQSGRPLIVSGPRLRSNAPVISGFSRSAGCKTLTGKQCVFPFRYKGVTYDVCTTKDNAGIPWCAVEATEAGAFSDSQWENCNKKVCTWSGVPTLLRDGVSLERYVWIISGRLRTGVNSCEGFWRVVEDLGKARLQQKANRCIGIPRANNGVQWQAINTAHLLA